MESPATATATAKRVISINQGVLQQRQQQQQQQQQRHPWSQIGKVIDGDTIGSWSGEHLVLSGDGSTLVVASTLNFGSSNASSSSNSSFRRGTIKVYRQKEIQRRKKKNEIQWVQVGNDIDGVDDLDDEGDGVNNVSIISLKGINSVAVSYDGQMVAVGAIYNDVHGNDAGNVRTYQLLQNSRSNGSNKENFDNDDAPWSWLRVGNVINGDDTGDMFGYSVSLSDDGRRMATGAIQRKGAVVIGETNLNANENDNTGHVRIYQLVEAQESENQNTANWVQLGQDINGVRTGEECGYSVSLSGDGRTVAIGAPLSSKWPSSSNDENNKDEDGFLEESGVVHIYTDGGNEYGQSEWVNIGSIYGDREKVNFGTKVHMSNDGRMLIAAATPKNLFNSTFSTFPASYLSSQVSGYVQAYRLLDSSVNVWNEVGNRLFARTKVPGIAPLSVFDVASSSNATTIAVSYSSTSEDITKADLYGNVIVYHLTNNTSSGSNNDDTLAQRWEEYGQKIELLDIHDVMKDSQVEVIRDDFGFAISLSGDSETIALGAPFGNLGVGTVMVYDIFPSPPDSSSALGFFIFSVLVLGGLVGLIFYRRRTRQYTMMTAGMTDLSPSSRLQSQSLTNDNNNHHDLQLNQFPLGLSDAGVASDMKDSSLDIGDIEIV